LVIGAGAAAVYGLPGLQAAAIAAGISLTGGLTALGMRSLLRGPEAALYSMLTGLLFRTGIPLLAAAMFIYFGGPLVDAGIVWYLLAFYILTLVVETWSTVAFIRSTQPTASRAPVNAARAS
jgi:hypothetical protein